MMKIQMLLSRAIFFWKPDVEFTTPLSIKTCRSRLKDLGAAIYERHWPWQRSDEERITFFLKSSDYSSLKQGPALSGELRETEDGTKVRASFTPTKPYLSILILLIIILYSVFYIKQMLWIVLAFIVLIINASYIYSSMSSWEYLETELYKNLKSRKRTK